MGAHRVPIILACLCLLIVSSVSHPAEKVKVLIADSEIGNGLFDSHGYYAKFAALAGSNGFAVEGRMVTCFTAEALTGVDILVLPIQARSLADGEIIALQNFIKSGGGILILGYHEDFFRPDGADLASLGRLTATYGIGFGESSISMTAAKAVVVDNSPLSGPKAAGELYSPSGRVKLTVVKGRAVEVAVLESGGILVALSTDKKALGKGRLVVCGDASMPSTEGSPAPIDTADNAAFFMNTLTYLAGGPDLGISRVKFTGDSVDAGDDLTVITSVKNTGNRGSGAAVLTIMLVGADGESPTAAMTPLKTSKVKPLPPGTARKYKLKVVIPTGVDPGEYLLFVKVETKNGGADADVSNNSMASRKSLKVN
jgi:hypothetical protein